ncbi:unnamed protein product [Paramecium sonneborni]|uniref:Transmembrane protein n=1 Tax=Paramecium sonneborni TaxID=65129 RepID=A0A8S1NTM3_9CILI|nr:unnamed protein product [Paramecium sonneborni]
MIRDIQLQQYFKISSIFQSLLFTINQKLINMQGDKRSYFINKQYFCKKNLIFDSINIQDCQDLHSWNKLPKIESSEFMNAQLIGINYIIKLFLISVCFLKICIQIQSRKRINLQFQCFMKCSIIVKRIKSNSISHIQKNQDNDQVQQQTFCYISSYN